MNQPMQPAIQHLFQVSALEDVSLERLESFVEEYPCFGFGWYLLSRKLRTENSDRFTTATQKTSLYFSNPFWLEWLLENTAAQSPAPQLSHSPHPSDSSQLSDSPQPPQPPSADLTSPENRLVQEPGAEAELAGIPEIENEVPEPPSPAAIAQEEPQPLSISEDEEPQPLSVSEDLADEEQVADPVSADPFSADPVPADPTLAEPVPSAAELLLASIEQAREIRESLIKLNEGFLNGETQPDVTQPDVTQAADTQPGDTPSTHIDEPIRDEEPPFILEEQIRPETPLPEPAPASEDHLEPAPVDPTIPELSTTVLTVDPTAPAIEQHAPSPAPTTIIADPTPIFEPFHTIDYFASQGIRLTLEENPTDPLGRQLKSFTEWLKVMRRLPQKEREIIPDRAAEQSIQSFAAHSIEGKEVVTETMAEVLAKQGMPERARIVYEKLSLLNPDKSAYFAAKIEQLNIH
jgi:hypothetical protein